MTYDKLTYDNEPGVLYGRYSSHTQKDTSIEQQFRECRQYCESNSIRIVGEYEDRALTGRTDKRPEFQRMIKDAAKGRFKYVIVWKVDRFARNRYDSATYKARLKKYGVRVLYAKESIPDGPEGILLESVLEGSAEYYSANLSQNIKRGIYENAMECKVNNGRLALGYRKGPDGRYEIDPTGASVIKSIFQYYSEGWNMSQIIKYLNSSGIKTSYGREWNKNSLHVIMKNERYIGVYKYGDVRIEGGCPAIIDKELFDRVQQRVERVRKAPAAARTEVDYMLTGKLFCGHCQSAMSGKSGTSQTGAKYYYYACNKLRSPTGHCVKNPIRKDWIEEIVVTETKYRVLRDEIIDTIAKAAFVLQERERDDSPLLALENQLAEVNRSIKNLINAIEQGIITLTTKQRLMELEARKSDLVTAIEDEKLVKPILSYEQIAFWLKRYREGDVNDEKYQIALIDTFINSIYLYNDRIKIVYNYSGNPNSVSFDIINSCEFFSMPSFSFGKAVSMKTGSTTRTQFVSYSK